MQRSGSEATRAAVYSTFIHPWTLCGRSAGLQSVPFTTTPFGDTLHLVLVILTACIAAAFRLRRCAAMIDRKTGRSAAADYCIYLFS
jgi:hypothetical protein